MIGSPCLNMCSYVHNVSMKMTLCVWAVNILTFTPNKFVICLSKYFFFNLDIILLNNCCNINCSRLLFVSCKTTGAYLTYSNNINFPKWDIRWEIAFKPTHVLRKSCLPLYILCVELSRFRSRRL